MHCEIGELLSVTLHGNEIALKPMAVEEKYSEDELNILEELFKSPRNRGKMMNACKFKKCQEKL